MGGLDHAAVEAVVGDEVSMLGESVVQLPVLGLESLAAAVMGVTVELGRRPDVGPFAGHLTLARVAGEPPPGVLGQPFTAAFTVDAVHLVSSELGGDAARYATVASFPLGR